MLESSKSHTGDRTGCQKEDSGFQMSRKMSDSLLLLYKSKRISAIVL